ncbi:hypothetical protein WT56_08460 [Burkholderia pseudomultivorans]|uniref:Uncharacterized protein n=1 Tax=Burkholderia pseudomultivorans TaxID=1207504 RepID=A0A132ELK5_9BURK|nr:hypothetical protein WT56_08460 [Burkholderia pseudomultivorans]
MAEIEPRPVDRELIELLADERPVDVDVDSDKTALLVAFRLVDSEPIELLAEDKPVDVEVDKLVMLEPVVLATA